MLLAHNITRVNDTLCTAWHSQCIFFFSKQLWARVWLCGRTPVCHTEVLGLTSTRTKDFYYFFICTYLKFSLTDNADFLLTTDDTEADTGISAKRVPYRYHVKSQILEVLCSKTTIWLWNMLSVVDSRYILTTRSSLHLNPSTQLFLHFASIEMWPRIEPAPSQLAAQSLSHRATRAGCRLVEHKMWPHCEYEP